ncbi:MAG TPA: bifunctional ADP-heptose synthase, partial [bacterium]|nr:bifunctional ADP-heptose synthase [bacterium]
MREKISSILPPARWESIVSCFPRVQVAVIGDIMLDLYIRGEVKRISPEAPVPVVEVTQEQAMLGGAGNVAANISSLGGRALVAGVIGQDANGQRLKELISSHRVASACLMTNQPTTTKTRVVARTQQLVRIDRERKQPLHFSPALEKKLQMALKDSQAVIISDYGKGVVTPKLIERLRLHCHRHGKILMVDPKVEHFSYYRKVTCLTPNKAEASAGIHVAEPETMEGLLSLGERIVRKLNCQHLLITLGREGMLLFAASRQVWHIPAAALEVYDVTGAGDTVIAALTLAMASGASILEAAIVA